MPKGVYQHHPHQGFSLGHQTNSGRVYSPETIAKLKQNVPSGKKSVHWKGLAVGYNGAHAWIAKIKGKPKKCERCKSTTKKLYDWANKDHKYSRNPKDYIRLCRGCHIKFDIENNNRKSNY